MEIEIQGLSKRFQSGPVRRVALEAIDLRIKTGECVALIGASGSGKSTLLRHIGGLVAGDDGEIRVGGRIVQRAGKLNARLRDVRADIGFVFQSYNLVGRMPLLTNVLAGLIHRRPLWRTTLKIFRRADRLAAMEALERVGMAAYAMQRASTLSGGQQQRAAIARTLVQKARVVLADEPIASLDPRSARRVMDTLRQINREDGVTCLVSLHQVEYALQYCARTVALAAGRIVYDGPSAELSEARLAEIYGGPWGEPAIVPNPEPVDGLQVKPAAAI